MLIVFVLWVWSLMARRASAGRNELAWCETRYRLAAAGTLWVVLCSAYGFEDVGARFRDMDLRSRALTRLLPAIGALLSPLPAHLVRTVDYQINDSHLPAYLDGRVNTRGFFDDYLRAIVYKSPPALLVLVALSLLRGKVQLGERPLLVVGVGLLVLLSLLRFKNIGIRYVL